MMAGALQQYKDFIDGLVARAESIVASRVRRQWRYDIPSQAAQEKDRRTGNAPSPAVYERFARYNRIVDSFTDEQRDLIIGLLQDEKLAGMQEVLAFLSDNRYQVAIDGTQLPLEPFDTPYSYDLAARYDGQPWPDAQATES
jgi:hypothetical protein